MSDRDLAHLRPSGETRIGIAIVTDSSTDLGDKPGLKEEIQSAMNYSEVGPGFPANSIDAIEDLELDEMYPSYFGESKLNSLELQGVTGIYLESEFPQMVEWQVNAIPDAIEEATNTTAQYYTVGPSTTTKGRFGLPRPMAKSRLGVAVVTEKPVGIQQDPSVIQSIKRSVEDSSANAEPATVEPIETGSTSGMSSSYYGTDEMDPLQVQNEKGVFMTFEEPAFTGQQLKSIMLTIGNTTEKATDYFTVGTL
jgi:hypothetical protein